MSVNANIRCIRDWTSKSDYGMLCPQPHLRRKTLRKIIALLAALALIFMGTVAFAGTAAAKGHPVKPSHTEHATHASNGHGNNGKNHADPDGNGKNDDSAGDDGNNGSGNDPDCSDDNNGHGPKHCHVRDNPTPPVNHPKPPKHTDHPKPVSHKTTICHWANHKYIRITVDNHALPAHARHQDGKDIIPAPATCPVETGPVVPVEPPVVTPTPTLGPVPVGPTNNNVVKPQVKHKASVQATSPAPNPKATTLPNTGGPMWAWGVAGVLLLLTGLIMTLSRHKTE